MTPDDEATETMIEGVQSLDLTPNQQAETIIEAVTQMEKPDRGITESDYAQQQLDKILEVMNELHLPPTTQAEMLIQAVQELEGLSPDVEARTIRAIIEDLITLNLTELPALAQTHILFETLGTLTLSDETKAQVELLLIMQARQKDK
ncbi:MAG: hypothetical protein GY796_23280 [Chloroflexi bacterium]|nr:hypothetical protein [Chloroflexota bacterium]